MTQMNGTEPMKYRGRYQGVVRNSLDPLNKGRLLVAVPEVLGEVFRQHWWYLSPVDAGLVHDPAQYCRWRERS